MSSASSLVSCSNKVLIHSVTNSSPAVSMDHHDTCELVNYSTWSHNAQVVATSADDGKIFLNHAKSGKKMTEL